MTYALNYGYHKAFLRESRIVHVLTSGCASRQEVIVERWRIVAIYDVSFSLHFASASVVAVCDVFRQLAE